MDVRGLIDEIIGRSTYLGNFSLDELVRRSEEQVVTGLGVAGNGSAMFVLAMVDGEPNGALFADEKGSLFGDKAVFQIDGSEDFRLYQVALPIIEALVARCRVYDRSHLKKSTLADIPTLERGMQQRIGVLCLTVVNRGTPVGGVHVSIRKGKLVLATDTTTADGSVCFKLLSGRYTCVVSDRTGDLTRFVIDFAEARHESIVDIGGTFDEDTG
ncbi:hypothetical protein ABH15_03760 [Methanoculleus taiwanensis]|uniref:Uncharacterized protein n=1 Tax=Methanoculleus taiwanensis TaxID=1550565 RepID=A0A498H2E4_9EURY|nr:hypothetical protein [Methanoculleus taiwanensis]RXE57231.1 hypothetical protein ABH15_03760 [Methanoculleus taiwanensis]